MTDAAIRIAEAEAATSAWNRFVGPSIENLRTSYRDKLADIAARPMTHDNRAGLEKLAVALKVVDQIEVQMREVMSDGRLARDEVKRADRMANLTTEQRKWYNW